MIARKILIVEDEPNLGLTLNEYLRDRGHQCALATSVSEGRQKFASLEPDLVLMDIDLPDGNGLQLASEFKARSPDLAFLFVSALNDPHTRVAGLELGACDYITKPFALKELTLRLDKIPPALPLSEEITCGKLKIRFQSFEVENAEGEVWTLGQKENAILRLLYRHRGKAVERDKIIEQVWGKNTFPSNRTVDNYIVKLRKWCESDPDSAIGIQSIRGIGYN